MLFTPPSRVAAARSRGLRRCALALATSAALSGMGAGAAHAEDLLSLYQAARAHDAGFLAAQAQAEAARHKAEQAKALQRPSVALQASINRSKYDSDVPPSPPLVTSTDAMSTTKRVGVVARQPLYNAGNQAQVDQAEQSLVVAQADLQTAEQDLIVRLTQAYFDVLAARDVLQTTQANKKALDEQLAAAKRSFEVGNATITDTREAQARFDLATAQELAAANDLRVKQLALDQLVGKAQVSPDPLANPSALDALAVGDMEEWVQRTQTAPLVRKAETGLRVAELEVARVRAGHLPTVDLVGNVSRADVDSKVITARTSGGDGTSASLGVEMNLSLYAGGAIQNQIREALSLAERSRQELEQARRGTALSVRQAFLAVQSGLAQVKAYEAAESSARLALEATQLGYRVGVRINKDVLDAQTQLTSTQKDLYKARYDVIVGSVRLRQASGSLSAEDIGSLNKLLAN